VLPAAGLGLGWLVAQLVDVAALAHFTFVALLVTCLVATLGWQLARVLMFPLLFLFFGVPIGEFLLPVMMQYTADFTVGALRASGVPVYREGMHFVIPNGRWSVVEACSGLRYLVASLMIGALYAYLNYASLSRRLKFMAVALLVPIVANWIRAYLTVMIGYVFGNDAATGFVHVIYGWVFFGVVIFVMFRIGARWHEAPAPVTGAAAEVAAPSVRRWLAIASLAAVVAAFPLSLGSIREPVADFSVQVALPPPAPGWEPDGRDFRFRPHLRGQRGDARQLYLTPDGEPLALYVAYFARQQAGHEMVTWGNGLVPPGSTYPGIISEGRDEIAGHATGVALVRSAEGRFAVRSAEGRVPVWHWYRIGGRVVTSDVVAKLLLTRDLILQRPDDAAYVSVAVPVEDDIGQARRQVEAFLAAHEATLNRMLDAAAAGAGR
jgi:exosortase A